MGEVLLHILLILKTNDIWEYTFICTYMDVYTYIYVYRHICLQTYMYVYVMYLYTHLYVYLYIHTYIWSATTICRSIVIISIFFLWTYNILFLSFITYIPEIQFSMKPSFLFVKKLLILFH
jgi:hypothetical protein